MTHTRASSIWLFLILLASPVFAIDSARVEIRVDKAITEFNLFGKNVLVAVISSGIDWQNGDFRNGNGSSRIKYFFDLSDNTGAGAPDNKWGRGTIYRGGQIDTSLIEHTKLPARDAIGTGSAYAGIAGAVARTLKKYQGIAPLASYLIVKVYAGAPSHDSTSAEADLLPNDDNVIAGIDFIHEKAKELGMPCVVLADLRSLPGDATGNGKVSRFIDSLSGPGLIFITGSGDDGEGLDPIAGTHSAIVATSYVIRNTWDDINGQFHTVGGPNEIGALWEQSNVGPAPDDRLGIDIGVPGNMLVTTFAEHSYAASVDAGLIKDGFRKYGIIGGTAAAAAVLTGVVALMLEVDPTLDATKARQIIHETARTDAFTGTTPNPSWGYGKLDAYVAITRLKSGSVAQPTDQASISIFPNPVRNRLHIELPKPTSGVIELYSTLGQKIQSVTFSGREVEMVMSTLPTGVYMVEVRNVNSTLRRAVIVE